MSFNNVGFPVNKSYVKTSRTERSIEQCDNLSYSYSCIKAFEQNQQIIGAHANLNRHRNHQILNKNPKLFTTSGDRDNPLFQPFYYTADCNQNGLDINRNSQNNNYDNIDTCSLINTKNDMKQELPKLCSEQQQQNNLDINVVFQWIKYNFKNINTLWPFSKPIDDYVSRIFKRKQQCLKVEMMLNNIDKDAKENIKRHMDTLNLNFEERTNLCNETIFEVDITPTLGNVNQLQDFLRFLKNTELKYSRIDKNNKSNSTYCEREEITLNKNTGRCNDGFKSFPFTKSDSNPCGDERFNRVYIERNKIVKNLSHDQLSKTCFEMDEVNLVGIQKRKHETRENNCDTHKPVVQSLKKEKCILEHPEIYCELNTSLYKENKTFKQDKFNEPILNSTVPNKNAGNIYNAANDTIRQSVYDSKAFKISHDNVLKGCEKGDVCETTNKNISCKCLIHNNREDFNRYKNQCLFGKGDEISNSFIKFVDNQEKHNTLDINLKNKRMEVTECEDSKSLCTKTKINISNSPTPNANFAEQFKVMNMTGPCSQNYDLFKEYISKYLNTDKNLINVKCSIEQINKYFSTDDSNSINQICVKGSKLENKHSSCKPYYKTCFDEMCSDTGSDSSGYSIRQTENPLEMESDHKRQIMLNNKPAPISQNSDEYRTRWKIDSSLEGKLEVNNKNIKTDKYRKMISDSKEDSFITSHCETYRRPAKQCLENLTEIVLDNLRDEKMRSVLQDNLNSGRKIDVVLKNAEEIEAKLQYLNKCFNEKKENSLLYKDKTGDSLRNKKGEQDELIKTTQSKTAVNKSNNRFKYSLRPKSFYRSISSIFKFGNNKKKHDEIHQIGGSNIKKLSMTPLEKKNKNTLSSREKLRYSTIEQNRDGYVTNDAAEQAKNLRSCTSQNDPQDDINLDKLCTEVRNQREDIKSIKQLLFECLNKH